MMDSNKERFWKNWWEERVLFLTRNDFGWIVVGVIVVSVYCGIDWDFVFGYRP